MINYQTVKLADIMPDNLMADERVACCCRAIDDELGKVAQLCSAVLLISRIDELPEDVIDLLAWQWHVDFYDGDYDVEAKRKLVKQSIDWHRRKGTPAVVREVVSAALQNAEVSENWEYGGQPYCFRIRKIEGDLPDGNKLNLLLKNIQMVKNTRSHLDGIAFYRGMEQTLYTGGALCSFNRVVIGLPKAPPITIKASTVRGAQPYVRKTVTIGV